MSDGQRMDDRLRAAIGELRDADMAKTPSFGAVLQRRSQVTRVRPQWGAWAAAAALVLGIVVTYRATRPQPLQMPSEVVALSSWTPATDVLLRQARNHLPTQTPRFGASMLDTLRRDFR